MRSRNLWHSWLSDSLGGPARARLSESVRVSIPVNLTSMKSWRITVTLVSPRRLLRARASCRAGLRGPPRSGSVPGAGPFKPEFLGPGPHWPGAPHPASAAARSLRPAARAVALRSLNTCRMVTEMRRGTRGPARPGSASTHWHDSEPGPGLPVSRLQCGLRLAATRGFKLLGARRRPWCIPFQ